MARRKNKKFSDAAGRAASVSCLLAALQMDSSRVSSAGILTHSATSPSTLTRTYTRTHTHTHIMDASLTSFLRYI